MKIIFAGTPVFAERHLASLLRSDQEVVSVYTQPDRPSGRGKKLTASPVKTLALDHDIPVYQPANLKTLDTQAELAEHNADILVVVAYGLILPKPVLDIPRFGCINVHGSILPRWRGAAPIQRAIQHGDTESGVTIMQMDTGLDTGAMLLKAKCDISECETSASLHDKLCELGPPALLKAIDEIEKGQAQPEPQDDQAANYASKIEKHEAIIDWSKPAQQLAREIRAFNPFPISYGLINGERVKIHEVSIASGNQNLQASEIKLDQGSLYVGCGQGALALHKIQFPGKKPMQIKDFLNGNGQNPPADKFDF